MSNKLDKWNYILANLMKGLGAYEPIPAMEELLKFLYNGLVIVDSEGKLVFMDRPSEKWFGLSPGSARGRNFSEFFPWNLGLIDVARTGIPQVGQVQEIRGKKRFVTRLPIIKNRQVIGAVGTVAFHDLEGIEEDLGNDPFSHSINTIFRFKDPAPSKNRASYTFNDILGISQSILATKKRAIRIANTDSAVLIAGETGTGKELFAHSIHALSDRGSGPFVTVNCSAIPLHLAESEFFGYAKGSFTGGNSAGQKGKFEIASGGTIFLDEISSMPLDIQAKLLRVIQEKEIQPLGCKQNKRVDFRLITATNTDLLSLVRKGSFRGDLYYRLSSVPIVIPPLRQRREDISFLVTSFLPNTNRKLSTNIQSISSKAFQLFNNYSWPGNVRELINILEQSAFSAYPSSEIDLSHLPDFLNLEMPHRVLVENNIHEIKDDAERRCIEQALQKAKGNKKKAAELLGISRAGLYNKLHRLGMK